MKSNLVEGQSFPPGYRLDRKLSQIASVEAWVATSEQTGDRVFVRLLLDNPPAEDWLHLITVIDSVRGLVHENINLVRLHGSADGIHYLIEPFIAGGSPFSVHADNAWQVLKQLIDTLEYIHQLGQAHGTIHPHNLVVDNGGTLHLTGMGISPDWSADTRHRAFLSPQVETGTAPDPSDDIYSLGCLIYSVLTGRFWERDQRPEAPLPASLEPLVTQMMSETPFERNVDLDQVRSLLARHFDDDSSGIATVDFTRQRDDSREQPVTAEVLTRQSTGISSRIVGIGFVALLMLGASVFYLLPESGSDDGSLSKVRPAPAASAQASSQKPAEAVTPDITPVAAARLELMQEQGDTAARQILRLQLDLEDQGVPLWAGSEYAAITIRIEAAEELFRSTDFEAALSGYESITEDLELLKARIPTELAAQIARGDTALRDGDSHEALTAFTIASAIDPDGPGLSAKLVRAENLEEVLSLMRRAEMHEREDNLDGALSVYQNAYKLDGLWQPAEAGITRIREAIRQRDFRRAMSLAFQHIASKDYEAARARFADAQAIFPDSGEPADGLQQIIQAETSDAINRLRVKAEDHMAAGKWDEAITAYAEVLAISDSLEFAVAGLEGARWRQDLDRRLLRFLSDPPLLQSNEELQAASATLREATRVAEIPAAMQRQLDSLAKLISTARIEIPVTIYSDGKTSVTVRRHARLGTIDNHVIYLIPGRYTITGERAGYRDVRENLVLIAGRPAPVITVASTERVR